MLMNDDNSYVWGDFRKFDPWASNCFIFLFLSFFLSGASWSVPCPPLPNPKQERIPIDAVTMYICTYMYITTSWKREARRVGYVHMYITYIYSYIYVCMVMCIFCKYDISGRRKGARLYVQYSVCTYVFLSPTPPQPTHTWKEMTSSLPWDPFRFYHFLIFFFLLGRGGGGGREFVFWPRGVCVRVVGEMRRRKSAFFSWWGGGRGSGGEGGGFGILVEGCSVSSMYIQ